MKPLSRRLKLLRYLWHGIAMLSETVFFLLLLPVILITALLPERAESGAQKAAKVTGTGNGPRRT